MCGLEHMTIIINKMTGYVNKLNGKLKLKPFFFRHTISVIGFFMLVISTECKDLHLIISNIKLSAAKYPSSSVPKLV